MNYANKVRLFGSMFCFVAGGVQAQWFDQGGVLSITEENDIVAATDRHYTQGFKLAYLCEDNYLPLWLKPAADVLPTWGYSLRASKIGWLIGQSIYTPAELLTAQLQVNDRPYAGWLYTGFALQRRGLTDAGRPVLESCQLEIGVVGPLALAEESQDLAHEQQPQGWLNQIQTEPGVALKYLRAWVISPQIEGPRLFDFIPHAGFSLGNIDTSLRIGGKVRLGINLPEDFGLQMVNSLATTEGGYSPKHEGGSWGCYVFGGVEGRAVAYSEFLNGNMFRESHDVTPKPLVAQISGGAALTYERFEVGATWVWTTKEFKGQQRQDSFGALVFKVKL